MGQLSRIAVVLIIIVQVSNFKELYSALSLKPANPNILTV